MSIRKQVTVSQAVAYVADEKQMAKFLEAIPGAEEVRPLLSARYFGQFYDPETRRDVWVLSDGKMAGCVTLSGVSAEESAHFRALYDAARTVERVGREGDRRPVDRRRRFFGRR